MIEFGAKIPNNENKITFVKNMGFGNLALKFQFKEVLFNFFLKFNFHIEQNLSINFKLFNQNNRFYHQQTFQNATKNKNY